MGQTAVFTHNNFEEPQPDSFQPSSSQKKNRDLRSQRTSIPNATIPYKSSENKNIKKVVDSMRRANSKQKLQYQRKPLARPKSSKQIVSDKKKKNKKVQSAEKENQNTMNTENLQAGFGGSNQIMLTTQNNLGGLRMSKDSKIQLRLGSSKQKDNFSEMNPMSRISTESFHNQHQENILRKSLKKDLSAFKIEPKIIDNLKEEVKKEFKKLERGTQEKRPSFSLFSPTKKMPKKQGQHQYGVISQETLIKQQQAKSAQRVQEHKKKELNTKIQKIHDEIDQKRQLSKERREKRQKLKEEYFDLPFKKPSTQNSSAKKCKKQRTQSASSTKKSKGVHHEKRSSIFSPQKEAYNATGKKQSHSTGKKKQRDTSATSQKKREKILGYLNQQRMQRIIENKKKQKDQEREQVKLDTQLKSLQDAYKLDLEQFKQKQQNNQLKESKEFKRKARKKRQGITSDQKMKPLTRNKQLVQFQSQQNLQDIGKENVMQEVNLGRIQSQKCIEQIPERTEIQDGISFQTGRPVMSFNQQQIPQQLTKPLRATKSEKNLNQEEKLFKQLSQYRKRLQKAVKEQKDKQKVAKVIDYEKYSKKQKQNKEKAQKPQVQVFQEEEREERIIKQLDEVQHRVDMIRQQLESPKEEQKQMRKSKEIASAYSTNNVNHKIDSPETPPTELVKGIQILKTPASLSQDSSLQIQGLIISQEDQNKAALLIQKQLRGRLERRKFLQRWNQELQGLVQSYGMQNSTQSLIQSLQSYRQQQQENRRQSSGQFQLVSPLLQEEEEKSDLIISPDSQMLSSLNPNQENTKVERQIDFQQSLKSSNILGKQQEEGQELDQISPEVNPFLKESQLRQELGQANLVEKFQDQDNQVDEDELDVDEDDDGEIQGFQDRSKSPIHDVEIGPQFEELQRKQSDMDQNSFVNDEEDFQGIDSPMQIQDLQLDQKQGNKVGSKQMLPISQDATVNYLGSSQTPQITEPKSQISPVHLHSSKPFLDSDPLLFQQQQNQDPRRLTDLPVQNSQFQLGKPPLSKSREEQIAEIPLNLSSKLRKIVGSQSLAREVQRNDNMNVSESQLSDRTFDKNTFHEFTKQKLKNVVQAETEINLMMSQLSKTLSKKIKKRQVLLEKEKEEKDLTARTYSRKQIELEKWVQREKEELKETKKCFTQGCSKLSSLLNQLMDEQGRIKKQVKQIKDKKRLSQSFTNGVNNLSKEDEEDKRDQQTESGRRFSQDFISDMESYQQQASPLPISRNLEKSKSLEDSKRSPFNYSNKQQNVFSTTGQQQQNAIFILPQQSPGSILDPTSSVESLPDQEINQLIQIGRLSQEGEPAHLQQQHQQLMAQQKEQQKQLKEENKSGEKIKKNAAPKLTVSSTLPSKKDLEHVLKTSGSSSGRNIISDLDNNQIKTEKGQDDLVPSASLDSSHKEPATTPIMSASGEVKIEFPEEIELLEESKPLVVREREKQAEELTEFILKHMVKEVSERPFPPRAFIRSSPPKSQVKEEEKEQDEPVQSEISSDFLLQNKIGEKQLEMEIEKKIEEEEAKNMEEEKKKGIDATIEQVDAYVTEVFTQIKQDPDTLNSVLENISQPLYKDPMMILAHLQNSMPDPTSEEPEMAIPYQQSVLSVDLYLEIEKQRRGQSISQMKDSYQESNTESFIGEMENIHNKAIFDAINEAMDGFRPYGLKGPPFPWSKQNRTLTFKFGKQETIEYLLQKVRFRVIQWAHINAGMIPPNSATMRQKEQVELFRDQRLTQMLTQEADENECLWIDYEYEETQAKLDLADIILDTLSQEVCLFIAEKQGLDIKKPEEEEVEQEPQPIVAIELRKDTEEEKKEEEKLSSAEKFKRDKELLKAAVQKELHD